jgi:hypothetical protein
MALWEILATYFSGIKLFGKGVLPVLKGTLCVGDGSPVAPKRFGDHSTRGIRVLDDKECVTRARLNYEVAFDLLDRFGGYSCHKFPW